jgi:hypothetical protein
MLSDLHDGYVRLRISKPISGATVLEWDNQVQTAIRRVTHDPPVALGTARTF